MAGTGGREGAASHDDRGKRRPCGRPVSPVAAYQPNRAGYGSNVQPDCETPAGERNRIMPQYLNMDDSR